MTRVFPFFLAAALFPVGVAANDSDLELARELMYCGKLKMSLARAGNDKSEAATLEHKKAHELMIISTFALIPDDQKEAEYTRAQQKYRDDFNAAYELEKTVPNSIVSFMREKLMACDKLQTEKGLEAFRRGVEAMAKKPEPKK